MTPLILKWITNCAKFLFIWLLVLLNNISCQYVYRKLYRNYVHDSMYNNHIIKNLLKIVIKFKINAVIILH